MLTFNGTVDKEVLIAAARPYIPMHINKNDPTECEVPFQSEDRSVRGYVQFALMAGTWMFVHIRKEN